MNKLAIQETFPPGIVGREIVLAQMCHHYRRISTAKARVDTNLFKPPKLSLSRPLSAEVASIVQRSLSPRSPPKHRRCLKYEHEMGEHHIKPCSRSQTAESRLRATPEVYHPAVKSPKAIHHEIEGQQQATQTSLENSFIDEPPPKTKDEAVQTSYPGLYRPLDARSVQFLRDITTEALHRRAFTSSALNRIFLDHQYRNTYSLTQELMERELEELRRQLGMLPRHQSNGSTVSDGEALDALDTLVLDPRIKEQVIRSLRLSRNNDANRTNYTYFDRLREDPEEDQLPTRDKTNMVLNNILKSTEQVEESPNVRKEDPMPPVAQTPSQETDTNDRVSHENTGDEIQIPEGGWNAEVEDDQDMATATSSKEEDDGSDEEVENVIDSEDEVEDIQSNSGSSVDEAQSESDDDEEDEITQKEGSSKLVTEEHSGRSGSNAKLKSAAEDRTVEPSESSRYDQNKAEKPQSNLQPLKLENLTARDKWRSSLDVVKEESDSTTGQVSDISTASTPTEVESKPDRTTSGPPENQRTSASSSTYFSAENSQQTKKNSGEGSVVNEETLKSSIASGPNGNQTSSSTGGEIVRQMDDLLQSAEEGKPSTDSNGSLGQIVKHMTDLSDIQDLKQTIGKTGSPPKSKNEDDNKSETGSEVESVHSESEDEEEAESSEASEISSVHTE
ncbi:hypothetical protein GE061_002227 [Apolygus lucorum]|uniref:Uncharacterized protein n=1 Tax=Apolygus lucorum TaxID=248454 RepID=A0A6A4JMU3_APOLU|nr:hypothetical protein GE061_002227 [Apolygus lucorum]